MQHLLIFILRKINNPHLKIQIDIGWSKYNSSSLDSLHKGVGLFLPLSNFNEI
jgi:hypothetical protein